MVASRHDLSFVRRKVGAMNFKLKKVQVEFDDMTSALLVMRENTEALELSIFEARKELAYLKKKQEDEKEFLREMCSMKVDKNKVWEKDKNDVSALHVDNREKLHHYASELDMVVDRGLAREESLEMLHSGFSTSTDGLDGSTSGTEEDRSMLQAEVSRNTDAAIVAKYNEGKKQRIAELLFVTAKVKDARELWGVLKTQCEVARNKLLTLKQDEAESQAKAQAKATCKVLS